MPSTTTNSAQMQALFMRVDKLTSENWGEWKSTVLSLLEMNGLDEHTDSANAPAAVDPEKPTETETESITEWNTSERLCYGLLKLCISAEERVHTTGTTTAAELWANLCDVKEPKGFLGAITAKRQLYHHIAEPGTSISTHITKFRRLYSTCARMGITIADDELSSILMISLSSDWDNFIASLQGARASLSAAIPLSELITALCAEDERRRSSNPESAMRAVAASSSRSTSTCTNCKRTGHTLETCYRKGGGMEGQAPWQKRENQTRDSNKPDTAHVAKVQDLFEQAYCVSELFTTGPNRDLWLSDSGTTSMICNDRASFANLEPECFEIGGVVEGQSAIALGRGDVEVLSLSPDHHRIITLRNVIYCPTAATNLFSISKLDEEGGESVYRAGRSFHYDARGDLLFSGELHNHSFCLDVRVLRKGEKHYRIPEFPPSHDERRTLFVLPPPSPLLLPVIMGESSITSPADPVSTHDVLTATDIHLPAAHERESPPFELPLSAEPSSNPAHYSCLPIALPLLPSSSS